MLGLVGLLIIGVLCGWLAARLTEDDTPTSQMENAVTADLPPVPSASDGSRSRTSAVPPVSSEISAELRSLIESAGGDPQEIRARIQENPELARQFREAMQSGALGSAFGMGRGGGGGRNQMRGTGEAGSRDTGRGTLVSGSIESYAQGMMKLKTEEGSIDVMVGPSATITKSMPASNASDLLTVGTDITVGTRAGEQGATIASRIIIGEIGSQDRSPAVGSNDRQAGRSGGTPMIRGKIIAYSNAVIEMQTESGPQKVQVTEATRVRITLSASDAQKELKEDIRVGIVLRRGQDGGFSAVSVSLGDESGFSRGSRRGAGQGQRGGGQGRGNRN